MNFVGGVIGHVETVVGKWTRCQTIQPCPCSGNCYVMNELKGSRVVDFELTVTRMTCDKQVTVECGEGRDFLFA
jgi:hypothetical protein